MSWLNPSPHGIGRGDVSEGQLDVPMFAAFMLICTVGLFGFQLYTHQIHLTLALGVSLLVFGLTVVRVEIGIYVLIIAMLLSPEITAGAVGDHAERSVNLRYDDFLIIVIFLGVLAKYAYEGRIAIWRNNPINKGIIAYYGICAVSTLMALRISVPAWDRSVAFFVMLKMLQFYMIFWMVGLVCTSMREVRRMLTVFFTVSVVVCLFAISSMGRLSRVSAPFEAGGTEPNTLGGYLMVVIVLALSLWAYAPKGKLRWTLLAVALLALVPLGATLSRASYFSVFLSLTLLGIFTRRTGLLLALLVCVVASPWLLPEEVIQRIVDTFKPTGVPLEIGGAQTGIAVDTSTYERVYVWKKVAFNLTVWPWFGGGVSWETVLDSQYARVLIETGVFGFAAFAYLLSLLLRTANQTWRWSRDWVAKALGVAMLCITLGLMAHGLAAISFLIVRIASPFWFLTALSVCAREIAVLDHARRRPAAVESTPRPDNAGPIPLPNPAN